MKVDTIGILCCGSETFTDKLGNGEKGEVMRIPVPGLSRWANVRISLKEVLSQPSGIKVQVNGD